MKQFKADIKQVVTLLKVLLLIIFLHGGLMTYYFLYGTDQRSKYYKANIEDRRRSDSSIKTEMQLKIDTIKRNFKLP